MSQEDKNEFVDKTILRLTGDSLIDVKNTDELHKALYRAVEYIDTDVGTNLNMTSLILKQFADQLKPSKRPYTWSDYKHDAVQEMSEQDPGESAAPVKADA